MDKIFCPFPFILFSSFSSNNRDYQQRKMQFQSRHLFLFFPENKKKLEKKRFNISQTKRIKLFRKQMENNLINRKTRQIKIHAQISAQGTIKFIHQTNKIPNFTQAGTN